MNNNNSKTSSGRALGETIGKAPKNGAVAWIVAILTLLAGICVIMASKKLNPAMADMVTFFGQDTAWGGSLGSIFGIVSAVLIIPLGVLQTKISTRWLAVGSLIILVFGTILGSLTSDPNAFVLWRVVEGIGYSGIYAIGGVLITRWFDEEHRGVPMGIYTCQVGLGQIVILNSATFIMPVAGWQGLWMFVAVVAIVVIIGFVVIVRDWPRGSDAEAIKAAEEKAGEKKKAKLSDSFKVPILWVMCLMLLCFGVGMQGTMMFSNMILTQSAGVDNGTASLMSSLISIGMMVGPIVGGFVISKLAPHHKDIRGFVIAGMFILAFVTEFAFLAFTFNTSSAWITSACMGFLSCLWSPTVYILAADHSPSPELASVGITIFLFGQFAAGIIGPYVMGWFNATFGSFMMAKWLILGIGIVGAIAALVAAVIDRKFVLNQANDANAVLENK